MPLLAERLQPGRIGFEASVTTDEALILRDDRSVRVLQTSGPVEPSTWDVLNKVLFADRPDIELRVFGFYRSRCDLSFVARLSEVRRFSADCLANADRVECLADLRDLETLSLGIHELQSFDVLDRLTSGSLRSLSLGRTRSRKPSLKSIQRFHNLQGLYLEGQQRDIDAISHLPSLQELTLRSITVPNLRFLVGLEELCSLKLILGGTRDLSDLPGIKRLEALELWQVRGLNNLSAISDLHRLRKLKLQSLPNIAELPNLSRLTALCKVFLEDMKGLQDVVPLLHAPALQELIHVDARNLQPEHYEELARGGRLRTLRVGFGSRAKNERLSKFIDGMG